MLQSQIGKYSRKPELLNDDTLFELHEVVARYPFFQSARLLLLKNLFILHDGTFGKELVKNAIYIADRSVLYDMVEKTVLNNCIDQHDHEGESDRTLSLIDNFLRTNVAPTSSLSVDSPTLADDSIDSSTDYLLYMERQKEEETTTDDGSAPSIRQAQDRLGSGNSSPDKVGGPTKSERTLALIDQFLSQSEEMPLIRFDNIPSELPQDESQGQSDGSTPSTSSGTHSPTMDSLRQTQCSPSPPTNDNDDENDEGGMIYTENLARILIKQKRYSQALKIIKQIYLQNPQKNCYFADQIRFLEKLIINEKNKP
ncbi:MAG: hypothetical protein Q4E55_06240 [Bacteroidales bacterium]|nr:hypothetical protein [Bacteroidales bacterium]